MSAAALRVGLAAGGLLVAAVAALLVAWKRAAASVAGGEEGGEAETPEVVMDGWTFKSGVRLPEGVETFMDAVAKDAGFEVVITSGVRTAEEQAKAMQTKYDRYKAALAAGETPAESDDLHKLYAADSIIDELLPNPYSAWAAIIQAHADRGEYLSRHLKSGAIDLRTRDLSSAQVSALQAAVEKNGGRWLIESDHMHVDTPPPAPAVA